MAGFCSIFHLLSLILALVTVVLPPGAVTGGGIDGFLRWGRNRPFFQSAVDVNLPLGGHDVENGTRWAVLVAGSSGFGNYRHQADVCHAYQILKRGGLKDENIVVFMYDDIAMHEMNPRPGIIINNPKGKDVYAGVPKDYTGKHVTVHNLLAVLLGDKKSLEGGSGKVVDSKPNDRIFLYYSDHGGPGVLGMPNLPELLANDLIDVLKKKHAADTYKEMVIYLEACESGSIFEGLLPEDFNIYVTTASNAVENSYGTYCPGDGVPIPPEYTTCLGDLYSIAWMEDSDTQNREKETIDQQFSKVKKRTANGDYTMGSHVMEYGTTNIKSEKLSFYQGSDPATLNIPVNETQSYKKMGVVNQRDADLVFMWQRYNRSTGHKKEEIYKQINGTLSHRAHLDSSVDKIGAVLFGSKKGTSIIHSVRGQGLPVVDDWECLKSTVRIFEKHCGLLTQYGLKHMRAFANICNNLVKEELVEKACMATCSGKNLGQYAANGTYTL